MRNSSFENKDPTAHKFPGIASLRDNQELRPDLFIFLVSGSNWTNQSLVFASQPPQPLSTEIHNILLRIYAPTSCSPSTSTSLPFFRGILPSLLSWQYKQEGTTNTATADVTSLVTLSIYYMTPASGLCCRCHAGAVNSHTRPACLSNNYLYGAYDH